MTKLAVFRTDASPAIGGRPITRCLARADTLADRGWCCPDPGDSEGKDHGGGTSQH